MNEVDKMLVKQFLLRVRQEGYSITANPPRSVASEINMDIYRGKTKICTFDDRQLGERWNLQVRTDDSTREDIKQDYNKLFYMFIHLRDLYMIYEAAEPLREYDQSLGYRAIMQYGNCTLAVRGGNRLGEIEFGTFITGRNSGGYGHSNTILQNTYFDMDSYPLAKLDFASRSGLLPKEQLVTPENIKYLHGCCEKVMDREGRLFDDDTKAALKQTVGGLKKTQEFFREIAYATGEVAANIAQYIEANIFDAKGVFTKQRIDRSTMPSGLFAYDIQYSSDEMKPEKVWPSVIGRRFGTVITKKALPIGEKGYTALRDKDFTLNPEKSLAFREFQPYRREHVR
jgi:hypothetical protein